VWVNRGHVCVPWISHPYIRARGVCILASDPISPGQYTSPTAKVDNNRSPQLTPETIGEGAAAPEPSEEGTNLATRRVVASWYKLLLLESEPNKPPRCDKLLQRCLASRWCPRSRESALISAPSMSTRVTRRAPLLPQLNTANPSRESSVRALTPATRQPRKLGDALGNALRKTHPGRLANRNHLKRRETHLLCSPTTRLRPSPLLDNRSSSTTPGGFNRSTLLTLAKPTSHLLHIPRPFLRTNPSSRPPPRHQICRTKTARHPTWVFTSSRRSRILPTVLLSTAIILVMMAAASFCIPTRSVHLFPTALRVAFPTNLFITLLITLSRRSLVNHPSLTQDVQSATHF